MIDRETIALVLSLLVGVLQFFQRKHPETFPSPPPVVVTSPSPCPSAGLSCLPTPSPLPAASPTPVPLPTPSPAPSATAPPSPAPTSPPTPFPTPEPLPTVPPEGVCPGEFDHPPVSVSLGERPFAHRDLEGDRVYTFNTTPRDYPPYCPHRGNTGMCEQWAPCAVKYTPDATQMLLIDGKRVFENEPVERASNNQYLLRIRISTHPDDGSLPGLYYICVGPPGGIHSTFSQCHEYWLSLPD